MPPSKAAPFSRRAVSIPPEIRQRVQPSSVNPDVIIAHIYCDFGDDREMTLFAEVHPSEEAAHKAIESWLNLWLSELSVLVEERRTACARKKEVKHG